LVCGWLTKKAPALECFYHVVLAGFQALGTLARPFAAVPDAWEGDWFVHEALRTAEPDKPDATYVAEAGARMPAWAGSAPLWQPRAPPTEPAPPVPLAPSRPENVALGSVPDAASPLVSRDAGGGRFRRGQLVHALLQHLPALPDGERAAAALRFLSRPGHLLLPGEAEAVVADVLAVLAHPDLTDLFGPAGRAEVALTGLIEGRVVGGLVDRLAVLPDRVLVADYKTNRVPPATLAAVPVLYLRQMASYRSVLQAIHPDRPVLCALVWTVGAHVMALPPEMLDRHAPGAEQSA
jgi:ATP-dependent helicase/nuclease subunit A